MGLPIPIDLRQRIIETALPQLAEGISTDVIGQQFGITGRAIRNWLLNDPEAEAARAHFLTERLLDCGEAIEKADSAIPLTRARELFRYWAWIAERRLPQRFGPKQAIEMTQAPAQEESGRPKLTEREWLTQHGIIDVTPDDHETM